MARSKIAVSTLFLIFYVHASADNPKYAELPQHQIAFFVTNSLPGFTTVDRQNFNVVIRNETRYGFNGGVDYQVRLLNWFSLGTGAGIIFHRGFNSYEFEDSLFSSIKYSEETLSKGILELPLNLIFSAPRIKKFEFQFVAGISLQSLFYQKNKTSGISYSGDEHGHESQTLSLGNIEGIGFAMGPVFKIGEKQGVLIEPEFRFTRLLLHDRASSMGLKLGWFFNQLSIRESRTTKFPQQLTFFFTNAVTGYTKGYANSSASIHKEPRYGFNTGMDYNVKFLKWLSIGTGVGIVFHRSFSSSVPKDSLPPAPTPNYSINAKYSESTHIKGALEIPFNIIFSICQRDKIEFQFAISPSLMVAIYSQAKGYYILYGSSAHEEFSYNNSNGGNLGFGLSSGPVLKVGAKQGISIQPEFRLNQILREGYYNRAYSAGLKLGWFFNSNDPS